MNKHRSIKNRFFLVLTAFVFLLSVLMIFPFHSDLKETSVVSAHAADDSSNYRGYTEYTLSSAGAAGRTTAGILRQTVMYVYAKKGETICFGSDVADSIIYFDKNYKELTDSEFKTHGEDIVLIRPDGNISTFDTIPLGKGYINTRAQEKAGPNYDGSGNTSGYIPHEYEVEQEGIYEIRFHSFSGDRNIFTNTLCDENGPGTETALHRTAKERPNDPTKCLMSNNTWSNSSATVGAWDITVVDKNEKNPDQKIKKGRSYTNCLCLNIGQNNIAFSHDYYVVTSDGYIYKTSFNEIDPYGFVFFSNNRGLLNKTTNNSEYHSFRTKSNDLSELYDLQNVSFHSPTNKDTEVDKTFRIFFEEPDSELTGILYPKAYIPDQIIDIEFVGSKQDNISYVKDGGYFKFTVSHSTSATLKISFDEYNIINNTDYTPVYITENVFAGDNYFRWDGCDGSGRVIPEGVYYHGIEVSLTNHSGEYHFPLFDAENCKGNVTVERINKIYERIAHDDGSISDEDVTENFEEQKFNLYYNNSILPNEKSLPKNYLVTDPDIIKKLNKYSVPISSKADSEGNPVDKILSDTTNEEVEAVRVFNLKKTLDKAKANDLLLDEETVSLYFEEYLKNPKLHTDILYFDYYPLIADRLDYSEGVNSHETEALSFKNKMGDFTAIDLWTYSLGTPTKFMLTRPIIIEDEIGYRHSNIRGRVFFDKNNDGKYDISSGDYGISGVKVTADYIYTETRWEQQVDDEGNIYFTSEKYDDGEGNIVNAALKDYTLEPTENENEFLLKISGEYVTDENDLPLKVTMQHVSYSDEEDHTIDQYYADIPVHMETVTDSNGFYKFTGITMMEDSEDLGNIKISIQTPSQYYTLTTQSKKTGVFNTYGREEQLLSLKKLYDLSEDADRSVFFNDADVGYYYEEYEPPIVLKKNWVSDVTSDPNRPSSIIFHIIAVDKTTNKQPYEYSDEEIFYEEDIKLNYFNNSWSKTMEHLPAKFGDIDLKYLIKYEKFTKNGITYIFDGQSYKDAEGNVITDIPYQSTMEPMVENYAEHVLSISNVPTRKSIEITKRDDNDRGKLVSGAYFKLEKYNDETDSWDLVKENVRTNALGLLSFTNVEVGKYRITETYAPEIYGLIDPFEIDVTDEQQVYKKTIYEPLSNVKLTVIKEFGKIANGDEYLSLPNQILDFKVELAYDEEFTDIIPFKYEKTFIPAAKQAPTNIFENIAIPNCDASTDVYIRITESGAGSYSFSASASASGTLKNYVYDVNGTEMNVDADTKTVVLKMQHGEDGTGFTNYSVTLKNTLDYVGNLRFQKQWFSDPALSNNLTSNPFKVKYNGKELNVLAVYARLMRAKKVDGQLVDPEVVIYSMRDGDPAAVVRENYGSGFDDKTLVSTYNCFTLAASKGWAKNCTKEQYFYLPKRAPDGSEYKYYIQEITNEYGNPYVLLNDPNDPDLKKPVILEDYKVVPPDKYTETFVTKADGTITNVKVSCDGNNINMKFNADGREFKAVDQNNYYLLNYYSSDIALQVTKNRLRDINSDPDDTLPLKGAEFTLFTDPECSEVYDKITTGVNGIGKFTKELKENTVYYLKETKAPTGYMIDNSVRKLEYEYTDAKRLKITFADDRSETLIVEDNIANITLTNALNLEMPETGVFFTAMNASTMGILLMATAVLAAYIYLRRSRKKAKTSTSTNL